MDEFGGFPVTLARDNAGNRVLTQFWTIFEAQAPMAWTGDVTPPYLTAFAVDMDAGTVTLSFSETVNAAELDVNCIIIQETKDNRTGGVDHVLRGAPNHGTIVSSGDAAAITLVLSPADLNELKRIPRLVTNIDTSYIAIEGQEAFRDNASSGRRCPNTLIP